MQIVLNEQGFVKAYALIGGFSGVDAVEVEQPKDMDDFEDNFFSYHLENGALVKNADKQKEVEDLRVLDALRKHRERACFPIINRGFLWFTRLTESQKQELDAWYQAWLDVTETREIPTAPEWLNDV